MNVSTLTSALPTKFAASSSSIDLPVKIRMSSKHLWILTHYQPIIFSLQLWLAISMLNQAIGIEMTYLVLRVYKLSFLPLNILISQVIKKKPNHILGNSEFCIDAILTSQPNIMDSGVHPPLHSYCHHQISYAKFDLKVFTLLLMKELCSISPGQILII